MSRKWWALGLAVLTSLLMLAGCRAASGQGKVIEVACEDLQAEQTITNGIQVAVGSVFTVGLCANPSTGFQWEDAQISDVAVLAVTAQRYVSPDEGEAPAPPGAAGQMVWTLTALSEGESTVTMVYSRPWEGGEKGVWTYTLTVRVVQ
jgi:inhibitor of cysteine peptidase